MSSTADTMNICLNIFNNSNIVIVDYIYLIIASIVSSSGFIMDSETVIIGTMLISPLLKPVILTALDIITPEQNNITSHMLHLISMLLITLITGFIFGKINLYRKEEIEKHNTIKSRVEGLKIKNIVYVIIIGLLCGIALGLSTFYDNGKFTSLVVGSGISTSILPPLIVGGINFAFKNYKESSNSILLSIVNFVTIFISFISTKYILC